MSLQEHRQAIDALDEQIVKLLNDRTKHVLEIGQIKLQAGDEIYVPHRERAVLDRVCKKNAGPITNEGLRAIYREVMSSALSLEKTLTIAGELNVRTFNTYRGSVGVEYLIMNMVFIRLGYGIGYDITFWGRNVKINTRHRSG
ncbi:MAG: chorismate mutase [Bacteroidota bacterium]